MYATVEQWQADCPWEIVTDEVTGVSVPKPPEWETLALPGVPLAVRQPLRPDGFAANVTVNVEEALAPHDSLAAYSEAVLGNMMVTLTDLRVIAIDDYELWGLPGRRILSAHRNGPYSLALEQYWFVGPDGVATAFSGTCDIADHLTHSQTFAYMVSGLRPAARVPHD